MKTLQDQMRVLMNKKGLSNNAIARALGISPAAFSQWLNNVYTGNIEKIDRNIQSFLQRQKEREQAPRLDLPFVPTEVSHNVFETARLCHIDGEIGIITGKAGVGKTWALREYAAMNSDVILIEADMGFTAKTLFTELGRKVGVTAFGVLHEIFEAIVEKLKNSGRMVIIDEAEYLPYRALEMLRRVHDKAGVGVLLAGMPRLISNLRGKKGDYAQLYSRVAVHCEVGDISSGDVKEILAAVIPSSNGIYRQIYNACNGNARVLEKLLKRSIRIMHINNVEMSKDVISAAMKTLII